MDEARRTLRQDDALDAARDAVERFVSQLQFGLDERDAEAYNRSFAGDVLWGTPFGEVVEGYDELHRIHRELHGAGVAGRSRYEVVRVLAPAVDVALGLVRRVALDPAAEFGFDETALYVLIRRDGAWWLAAGQNTPVREKPTAS